MGRIPPMTLGITASVVLGILLGLGGLALAIGNESTQTGRCFYQGAVAERYVRPGVAVDAGDSWWPLGTRCSYHYADGTSADAVASIPSSTVILIVVMSGAVAVVPGLVFAVVRRGRAVERGPQAGMPN